MKALLLETGQRARVHALSLSPAARTQLLREASGAWDELMVGTVWQHGKKDTHHGARFVDTLPEFAATLTDYAPTVVAKGTGHWFTAAISGNGRCRDQDIEWITHLAHDADDVGDWDQLIETMRTAGLAYLVQRSASHRPEHPKFHVHIPTTAWWRGEKREWRQIYRHCLAWLSVAADLRADITVPLYGFDLATDRMGQPWFMAAKRSPSQRSPETRFATGSALDLERFLVATEFHPLAEVPQKSRQQRPKKTKPAAHVSEPVGLLERAFAQAGWLAARQGTGPRCVLCPWRHAHSGGEDFDGSTVIFAPRRGGEIGWFHCSHAHCAHRTQPDVLKELPAEHLRQALTLRSA
jgi:hypothetical protein